MDCHTRRAYTRWVLFYQQIMYYSPPFHRELIENSYSGVPGPGVNSIYIIDMHQILGRDDFPLFSNYSVAPLCII